MKEVASSCAGLGKETLVLSPFAGGSDTGGFPGLQELGGDCVRNSEGVSLETKPLSFQKASPEFTELEKTENTAKLCPEF